MLVTQSIKIGYQRAKKMAFTGAIICLLAVDGNAVGVLYPVDV